MEVDKVAKSVAVSLLFLKQSVGGYYKNVCPRRALKQPQLRGAHALDDLQDAQFSHHGIKADGSAASQPALSGAGMMATVRTKLAFLFVRPFANYPGLCLESSPHA